jgi:AraC family transcriptional regulator, transcriptional activator of pobA
MDYNKLLLTENSARLNDDLVIYSGLESFSFFMEYPIRSGRIYIGLCLNGWIELEVNLVKHVTKKNEAIMIFPNNFVFHHETSPDFNFVLFSISSTFFQELSNDLRKYPLYFLFKQRFPFIILNQTEMDQIMEYYHLMWKTTEDTHNDYKRDIIKHLLTSMTINIHKYATQQCIEKPTPKSRRDEMIEVFFSLIFEHYKKAKDVSFYADKLCVSPKYLSTIVRKRVGKTPKECIDHYVILESRILLESNSTIQEVSQQLNFPNQSFFGKYFKKHTGMSPYNYRKSR